MKHKIKAFLLPLKGFHLPKIVSDVRIHLLENDLLKEH